MTWNRISATGMLFKGIFKVRKKNSEKHENADRPAGCFYPVDHGVLF
jgi:hypothetical protein